MKVVIILTCMAVCSAPTTRAHKPRKYHGVRHPHDGHVKGPNEHYPGHMQNKNNYHIAPKHYNHALLTAAMTCDEEKLLALLREGVPVDFPHDDQGDTALMYAAMSHTYANGTSAKCARILLDYGADVEWADNDGLTPLMSASWHKNSEIVHMLLDAGAMIDRQVERGADRGKIAADFARRSECNECLRLIKEHPRERAVAAARVRATRRLESAIRSYSSWSHWMYVAFVGGVSEDECALHRALDRARVTGVDEDIIKQGQALRSPMSEEVLDLLERRHICEDVFPYLYSHELYHLEQLAKLPLHNLERKTGLSSFEAHMLEMQIETEIRAHARAAREREHDKEQAGKEELRRLAEMGPCGTDAAAQKQRFAL
mmetsp:Transcript_67025/g.111405  ORF Transcript_67025/g.111405 Transcript_67025/m.111405 type:complete len:373 (+) Transcript_67025:103-1221(+)